VLEGNEEGKAYINLKGTMSGNPSTNGFLDANTYIPFLANHALVSIQDFEQVSGRYFVVNITRLKKLVVGIMFIILPAIASRSRPISTVL
jgi:hypothetical protein